MPDWYRDLLRLQRHSITYKTLMRGPSFSEIIKNPLPRDALVKEVQKLITPVEDPQGYSLIVGEHGCGKTSLIQLAISGLKMPKGVVYLTIPNTDNVNTDPAIVADVMRKALGWNRNPTIDIGDSK